MSPTALPDLLQRGTAIAIFALGIFMLAAHTLLAALAAQRSPLGPRAKVAVPLLVGGFLALWLGAGLMVGDAAQFPLASAKARRVLSLLVGFGPVVLAVLLLSVSRSLRAVYAAAPSGWLVRVQTYRMAGVMFLFPFLAFGLLPAGFALPAATGDFLTGLLAPWVARALDRQRPGAHGWAVAWNLFGILDLVVAPVAAVLTHAQVLPMWPLVLVPLFIGPPLGILTHLYSLRNLAWAARTRTAGRGELTGVPEAVRAS